MTELQPTREDSPSIEAHDRRHAMFEHLSRERVRAILNCLTESTFFYREDEPDLFQYLRRNRNEFARFFDQWFGWDLHVDRKGARLFKRNTHNSALTRKQRDLFDLTRREECILFMLLLEFHELQLGALNVHPEHDEDLCFEFADFIEHAFQRFKVELGDRCPSDRDLVASAQSLFRELERHRFIRCIERADVERGITLRGGQTERALYAFLPGIHYYDPNCLSSRVFDQAYAASTTDDATPDNATEPPSASDSSEPS